MPTYLVHGFRWPRPLIRIHIILNDLEDAAAEWLMANDTTRSLRDDLTAQHPTIMSHLPNLRFIEQYDPYDESPSAKSQPYAYVCDIVHEVKLGLEVDDVRGKGVTNEAWGAMVDLRDKLAPGEKVAWFVVVCGDVERSFPSSARLSEGTEGLQHTKSEDNRSELTVTSRNGSSSPIEEKKQSRLRRLFRARSNGANSLRRTRSNKALDSSASSFQPAEQVPPLLSGKTIEGYDKRNHATSSANSPPQTGNVAATSASGASTTVLTQQQSPKVPMNLSPAPRAGILPSPPVSALPSPAYPPHPTKSVPSAVTNSLKRGESIDSIVSASSMPKTTQPASGTGHPETQQQDSLHPLVKKVTQGATSIPASKQAGSSTTITDLPFRIKPTPVA